MRIWAPSSQTIFRENVDILDYIDESNGCGQIIQQFIQNLNGIQTQS